MPMQAKFWCAYGLLAVFVAGAIVLGVAGLVLPPRQHHVVTQAQLKAAVGESDVAKAAEKAVASSAAQADITVKGLKVLKVTVDPKDPNTATVRVQVDTLEIGTVVLDVHLEKGSWQTAGIARAG